jgi:hypothetical protein
VPAAAAGDGVVDAAPAAGCVVAGTPGGPPEAELLLRPFRLGPKPDVLKGLWQQIQKVRGGLCVSWGQGRGAVPRTLLRCGRQGISMAGSADVL